MIAFARLCSQKSCCFVRTEKEKTKEKKRTFQLFSNLPERILMYIFEWIDADEDLFGKESIAYTNRQWSALIFGPWDSRNEMRVLRTLEERLIPPWSSGLGLANLDMTAEKKGFAEF